jgi:hypothetical protein
MMKRAAIIMITISTLLIMTGRDISALTVEINMHKPGVQKFAIQYIQFNVDGKNIIHKLPSTFYIISHSPDDLPVLAARVEESDKLPGLLPYLDQLTGFGHSQSIKGVHGEKIVYNPDSSPDAKELSSYVIWKGWVLIGNKKETLYDMVKFYKGPSELVKADKSVSKINKWHSSGIKVWSDNSNDHLYKLFEVQKKRMMIPLLKDPRKIQFIAGAFILTDSGEMSGNLMIRPKDSKYNKDIEGDLKFIHETIRRKLLSIKSPYKGNVYSTEDSLIYETHIGNYMAAQSKIISTGH